MSKPRPKQRETSPTTERAMKIGLAAIVLAALVITFWPEPETDSATQLDTQPSGTADSTANAPAPPAPAPTAPEVPRAGDPAIPDDQLDQMAEAALIAKLLESDSPADISQFGTELLERRDYTNALALFERTVELEDDNEYHHFNLGVTLSRLKRYEEAKQQYGLALEIYPNYAQALNNLGTLLAMEGKLEEAEAHYRNALDVEPERASTQNNLGTILARQKEYASALNYFQEAYRLDPNYVEARFNIANALLSLGNTNEARAQLSDIINAHPDFTPAQVLLTRLMSLEAPNP